MNENGYENAYLRVYGLCTCLSVEEGVRCLEVGTGSYESLDMGAGNRTWVLKGSKY